MLTALEKDPHKRFDSVQTFATALEQACQPAPVHRVALPSKVPLLREHSLPSKTDDTPVVLPPLTKESVPSARPLQPKRRIPRRAVIVGLTGVAGVIVVGSGLTWLTLSRRLQVSSPVSHPTTTAFPTPTPIPLGTTLINYHSHSDEVLGVAWSPDGKSIASASADKTVHVWDAVSGNTLYTYHGHANFLSSVAWSPDGKRIASAGGSVLGTGGSNAATIVQVWDATTGDHMLIYHGHSDDVWAIAWSPDGKYIASASLDTTVQLWDVAFGKTKYIYRGHTDGVYTVAWSPDGRRIAAGGGHITTGGVDTTVKVWDALTEDNVLTYNGPSTEVLAVAWSPDSRRIASGNVDKTVHVWDAATGNTFYTYSGHSGAVYAVAWSPDGKRIASGGFQSDNTVQIWDAATGNTFYTYRGHTDGVHAVAWSPDGKRIASASIDKTVRVWVAK